MLTKVVFMLFLFIAAWQDYKTGEVDLSLLLTSFTATLAINTLGFLLGKSLSFDFPKEQAITFLIISAAFMLLVYSKKMGAADAVIFIQILVLFGTNALYKIMLLSSILGIALIWFAQLKNGGEPGWDNMKGQEIRFVPLIAFASQLIL